MSHSSDGSPTDPDPVDKALADAITPAAHEGRFDVVAALVKEFEARRRARADDKVVPIDKRRRRPS
jgi:hypothetical protein